MTVTKALTIKPPTLTIHSQEPGDNRSACRWCREQRRRREALHCGFSCGQQEVQQRLPLLPAGGYHSEQPLREAAARIVAQALNALRSTPSAYGERREPRSIRSNSAA